MSNANSLTTDMIEPGLYRWWAAGILVAAAILGLAGCLVFPNSRPLALLVAAGMAAIMLGTSDTRGRFRAVGLVISAGGLGVIYRFWFHQALPNRLLLGLGLAFLLFVYAAGGAIGATVGRARRHRS